ncbi:MAG: DUF447 domain-containing protein [Eubacteriales bacterium]
MIIETIMSTLDENGKVNFAPIGVHIGDNMYDLAKIKEVELYLYKGSQTFTNLYLNFEGVINFTNDILIFVETALFSPKLLNSPSKLVRSPRMVGANAILEFIVLDFDSSVEPARVKGKIRCYEEFDGFKGFCRAQGAVLEALIMATRLERIAFLKIEESWNRWEEIILKTGGWKEQEALKRIKEYLIQKGIKGLL